MKGKKRKLTAWLVSVCLFVCMAVPTYAANESNSLGVTFNASLDKPMLQVSDQDQTVVMTVDANKGFTVQGMGSQVTYDSALQLTDIANADSRIDFAGSFYLDTGKISWAGTNTLEQFDNVTNVATVTFTVPANTPAGTYDVGIKDIEIIKDINDVWESTASASTILTITEEPVGYSAGITSLTKELSVDESTTVNVGVTHSSDTAFAAGEVVLNYDNTKLAFDKAASTLGAATVKDANGTLTIEDYGTDKSFGTGIYALSFKAIADGATTVSLTSAAFVNKEDAVKSDLVEATLLEDEVALTINKKTFAVTLPEIFEGPATATDGEDYTFSAKDKDNYNYDSVTATVNGQAVEVKDNGDGTYTVENVTGALVVTGTRTEKTYTVTFGGNGGADVTDGANTATYNTDYSFTMPSPHGWSYTLESIQINGEAYTGYSVQNSVYTIPGSAISGNIVITINKVDTEANVTVEGTGAGAAEGYNTTVDMGADYTLAITPESGYIYTVSATMDGQTAAVIDNGDNTYTIKNVSGDIIFTVDRSVVVSGVSVSEYLTLNGTNMWLVRNEIELADGKVPTYDGENMFWSEEYESYCYLVISKTFTADQAAEKVGITDGTAVAVDYGMDVNKTGKVDASDAQLIYNMYNVAYNEFTADATIEKFLRADINKDAKVNVEDATAVITAILE